MVDTNILDITLLATNQTDRSTTVNDGLQALETATQARLPVDLTSSDVTITATQFTRNFLFHCTGHAVARILTVPLLVNATAANRFYMVRNGGSGGITVQGATGLGVFVDAGAVALLYNDGTDQTKIAGAGGVLDSAIPIMAPFFGVSVQLDSDLEIADDTATDVGWDSTILHQKFNGLSFWLGPNAAITVDTADDEVDLTDHGMITGDGPFQFTTTDTLPAGLSPTTDYWCIHVTNDSFQVATSYANALAGNAVDITDAGTGTHTIDRETRIVIPPGVTRVELKGNVRWEAGSGTQRASILYSEGDAGAGAEQLDIATTVNTVASMSSAIFAVDGGGDYFTLNVQQDSAGALDLISGVDTWLQIRVVETDESVALPYDVMAFAPGQFTAAELILRVIFPRVVEFEVDFAGSFAYSGVIATGFTSLIVAKNGVPIGTIDFDYSSLDGTFTLVGGATFQPGDRLEIFNEDPADATLANLSFTFKGTRA